MTVLRQDGIPLYHQLKEIFIEKIINGEWRPEENIPNELDLCEQYGVSRGPVRQALDQLVREGLLSRKQGKGTWVLSGAPLRVAAVAAAGSRWLAGASPGGLWSSEDAGEIWQRTGSFDNVRGVGSLIAFTLESPVARDGMLKKLADNKLLALPTGECSIRFRLPFVLTSAEVGPALERVADSVPATV